MRKLALRLSLPLVLAAMWAAPAAAQGPPAGIPKDTPPDAIAIQHDEPGVLTVRRGDLVVTSTVEDIDPADAALHGITGLLAADAGKKCRSQTVRTEKWGGNIWFKTKTSWCYKNGLIIGNPSLSSTSGSRAPDYKQGDRVWRTGGGNGQKNHSDKGKARFLTCAVKGQDCEDYYHVLYITKRQSGTGSYSSNAWYTTESR